MTRTRTSPRRRSPAAALAVALSTGALLAGCGGTSNDESAAAGHPASTQSDAASAGMGVADTATAGGSAADTSAAVPGAAVSPGKVATNAKGATGAVPRDIAAGAGAKDRTVTIPDGALTGRDVVYTADMTVQVADVSQTVSKIESAVRAAGGLVESSERNTEAAPVATPTGPDAAPAPRSSAQLVLRIPPGNFGSVLDRISGFGAVLDRNLTGKDVTEAVVDVKSRISSARTSVARVRDLMARAVTLRDVVALEGELSQREADLEALLAKQAKLRDQTSLATVTVRLLTAEQVAQAAAEDEDRGFAAGLNDGWDAFTGSMVVAATVVGALLPFAVALLVLGPPATWVVLRIRRALREGNGSATIRPQSEPAA